MDCNTHVYESVLDVRGYNEATMSRYGHVIIIYPDTLAAVTSNLPLLSIRQQCSN